MIRIVDQGVKYQTIIILSKKATKITIKYQIEFKCSKKIMEFCKK